MVLFQKNMFKTKASFWNNKNNTNSPLLKHRVNWRSSLILSFLDRETKTIGHVWFTMLRVVLKNDFQKACFKVLVILGKNKRRYSTTTTPTFFTATSPTLVLIKVGHLIFEDLKSTVAIIQQKRIYNFFFSKYYSTYKPFVVCLKWDPQQGILIKMQVGSSSIIIFDGKVQHQQSST